MDTVYSPLHRQHDPDGELADSKWVANPEKPLRAEVILDQIRRQQLGRVLEPAGGSLEPICRVHDQWYVQFLRTAHTAWTDAHGAGEALPDTWPGRTMHLAEPQHIDGKLGYYLFDAATPITAGSWTAAAGAADVAVTAAGLIAAGRPGAFAGLRGTMPAAISAAVTAL